MRLCCGLLVVLMMAGLLSGCGPIHPVRWAPAEEPALPEGPGVGEGLTSEELTVMLTESLPATGAVIVRGYLADGCTQIVDTQVVYQEESDLITVTLGTYRDPEAMCTMALVEVEEIIR